MDADHYRATASAYDLFAAPYQPVQLAALEEAVRYLQPGEGPILDIGAGSGALAEHVLRVVPSSRIVALEPSAAMRALLLGRIARKPEWFPRITLRPEGFFEAKLPERLGGAMALGVLGHFTADQRHALLDDLAHRLPIGAGFLIDLQDPLIPQRVEASEFTAAKVGDIEYRGIAEAWPVGDDRMRWRMTYLTLDGQEVLSEEVMEHIYHHPSPCQLRQEAEASGFAVKLLEVDSFWLLLRVPAVPGPTHKVSDS